MVEIYKVIAYTLSLNQIFDDKNKNGSVKGANNNQVYIYAREHLYQPLTSDSQRIFHDKKN